jgi:DNA mismatch repair protein MutL
MQDIIHVLPDHIANQIAAGEVVQRPASAVKELLENSIDAGAKEIQLYVKEAGKTLIQVVDDGRGMSEKDAIMCFERHATSKLKDAKDLFKLKSMGFRGEALASIAAVAQVELKTKPDDLELGVLIKVEASDVRKQEPIAMQNGTSLSIKNLFFNVPARRNFLKSNPVEFRHIHDEFQRISIAHAGIKFSLHHNNEEIYHQQQLIPCQEETPTVRITGYVGKPAFAKKTRGEQFFFVNHRFIKNHYLNHAVLKAFEGLLKPEAHPFYVLFIEMDPKEVDVNVHPTKTEVKFTDDRLLYGVIVAAVRQALATSNVAPSIDFDTDVNFALFSPPKSGYEVSESDKKYTQFKNIPSANRSSKNWELLYENAHDEELISREQAKNELQQQDRMLLNSDPHAGDQNSPPNPQTLCIHNRFLLRQVKSGMVLIDQRAAHERILYERYLEHYHQNQGVSQSCLFPCQLSLNPADFDLVLSIKNEIQMLGFEFEPFGKNCIVINGVPPEISKLSEKDLFEDLIEQFKMNQSEITLNKTENLARSMAKRTAIKISEKLADEEISKIFDLLFACKQPNYTPDGQATFVVLSLDKMISLFN